MNAITSVSGRFQRMGLSTIERERRAPLPATRTDFEVFVRGQRDTLVRLLRRRVPCEEDAQDLAQESLERLMRYRTHAPESWARLLYRIAVNALNDRLRRARARGDAQYLSLDEAALDLPSTDLDHEQQVAQRQELVLLQRALLGLPPRCREVYLLNRIEGMSYTQIAAHLGISVKAVEKHVGKALKLLRERLAPIDKEVAP
ncbi:RNA polymerase sigma factor [Fulvimonas soli]|nr:RNA polymerase sigma factor [Fulvimonas soli]